MVTGVRNHQWLRSPGSQQLRSFVGVASVGTVPLGAADPYGSCDRRDGAADWPEPGVALAEVVQEGRSHEVSARRLRFTNEFRTVDGVAEIGQLLIPEQLPFSVAQQICGEQLLAWRQAARSPSGEEPTNQVRSVSPVRTCS